VSHDYVTYISVFDELSVSHMPDNDSVILAWCLVKR